MPAGRGRQGALAVLRQQLVPDLAVAVPLPGEHDMITNMLWVMRLCMWMWQTQGTYQPDPRACSSA